MKLRLIIQWLIGLFNRIVTVRNIIILDAFTRYEKDPSKINDQQAMDFVAKLSALGIKLKNALILYAPASDAKPSAIEICRYVPNFKDSNLAGAYDLKAQCITQRAIGKHKSSIKGFTCAEAKMLVQSFHRRKDIIIVADGFAGMIGSRIAYLYDINGNDNLIDITNGKIAPNNIIVIKVRIIRHSASNETYGPRQPKLQIVS